MRWFIYLFIIYDVRKISFVVGSKYNTLGGNGGVNDEPAAPTRMGFTKKPAAPGLRAPPDAFRHIEPAIWESLPALFPIAIEFAPCLDTVPLPALFPIATAADP